MSKPANKKEKISPIASVYEWVEVICVALFMVVMLFTFVCRLVTVSGDSMLHTFYNGDRLIISDLFYEPEIGDVVVVQDSTLASTYDESLAVPLIKRVIAKGGDEVRLDPENWVITVTHKDGSKTVLEDEAYVNRPEGKKMYAGILTQPHVVEEGHVFVMGDNRNNSTDSRMLGDVDERMILGKVYLRVVPDPTMDFSK